MGLWKREILFRRDIYSRIPDDQLLRPIGIRGEADIEEIAMWYTKGAE